MSEKLTALLAACLVVPQAYGFTADGKFGGVAEGYSLGFDISFQVDSQPTPIAGGKLYFGTDASSGDHYMYFAMPKDFVDNSYGSTRVGWGNSNHTFHHLLTSDSMGADANKRFTLNPVIGYDNGTPVALQVDYLAAVKNGNTVVDYVSGGITSNNTNLGGGNKLRNSDSGVFSGDASGVKEIASSMEYNVQRYGPNGSNDISAADIANKTGYLQDSPEATVQTDGSYQANNPNLSDWIYEVAYEYRFDAGMFGSDGDWTDAQTALSFVDIGDAHVSPSKNGTFQDIIASCDNSFGDGCNGGGGPPPSVPEPGTGLLMLAGLTALGFKFHRKT